MKRLPGLLLSLVAAIALGGCATAYQSEGFTGGFSETQLAPDVFRVTFKGNAFTDQEKATDFVLLRTAEIALENGFQYFVIIDASQFAVQGSYTTPPTATTNVNLDTNGYGTATTTMYGGQTYNYSKPRSSNTIVYYVEKPQGLPYSADFIVGSIKEKYGIQ